MPAKRSPTVRDKDLQGLKYFDRLIPLLEGLHQNATERDRAHSRKLFFDQYACLVLLYFFNPILTGIRSIEQASSLSKVQRLFGCGKVSRTSFSEASHVFDPELLTPIIHELAGQALPLSEYQDAEALRGLTAVDGSLLRALPKMAWALWTNDKHRAAKMHVHFDVLKGIPTHVSITAANDSERDQFKASLKPGGFYVFDRGYRDYELFQEIVDAKASFVGRVQDNTVIHVDKERTLTPQAQAAGVIRDVEIKQTGNDRHRNHLRHTLRLVVIDTGKKLANGKPDLLFLCTNRLDLDAELIALAYRYRWTIELFFRWFKCVLGCQHLLSTSHHGMQLQVYLAIIASLLVSLWTGRKPTKLTLQMIQLYFSGWATLEELLAYLNEPIKPKKIKK